VIGVLSTTAPSSGGGISRFRSVLKEAGFVEGKNVAIEFHWANNQREMEDIAADIARRKVAVIVSMTPAVRRVAPSALVVSFHR
jgi:putative ABC transport system substrate-binding protein